MNFYKKFLLVLTIFTAVLCLGCVASADGDFLMRIDTVTVPAGYDGEVLVPVYIDSMPDDMQLSCFAWEFYFDSEKLTFISSKDPASFAGELILNPEDCTIGKIARIDGSEGKFRFGWTTTKNYITETGVALYLPFYVTNALEAGVYNIVADPFSDIRSGTESIIDADDLFLDINSYLIFGAIVVEGESETEYNDYEMVSSKAKYPTYVPEEESVVSGTVNEVNGVPVTSVTGGDSSGDGSSDLNNSTSGSGNSTAGSNNSSSDIKQPTSTASGNSTSTGTLISSEYRGLENDYKNDVQTIADYVEAGTMITYTDACVIFDSIKSQSGYLVCALYKGQELVGYDIKKAEAEKKVSVNVSFSEIPDTAISVIMREDGTFDCYGRYPVNK